MKTVYSTNKNIKTPETAALGRSAGVLVTDKCSINHSFGTGSDLVSWVIKSLLFI